MCVCVVHRFFPLTTQNVDTSWRGSSVLVAPPMPRCCSTHWTWTGCHTGGQTCRGSARTSAAISITPAGDTYQVITPLKVTMDVTLTTACVVTWRTCKQAYIQKQNKSKNTLKRYLCATHLKQSVLLQIVRKGFNYLDCACICRPGRNLDLCKKGCISSLVCEDLFFEVLTHLTSPPIAVEPVLLFAHCLASNFTDACQCIILILSLQTEEQIRLWVNT